MPWLSWWKPSGPISVTDTMRSVVTGEAASWGRGQWLASPSWKRRRPKSWPPSWAECALWSFLYIKVIKKILLQKKKKEMTLHIPFPASVSAVSQLQIPKGRDSYSA